MQHILEQHFKGVVLKHVTRDASAAPAVGYLSVHIEQQAQLVAQALNEKLD